MNWMRQFFKIIDFLTFEHVFLSICIKIRRLTLTRAFCVTRGNDVHIEERGTKICLKFPRDSHLILIHLWSPRVI